MANETTYALISSLTPVIWQAAWNYVVHNFVMQRYVTVYTDSRSMVARNTSKYAESAVTDNVAETDDLSSVVFPRTAGPTISPKEIAKQFFMTDRRVDSDLENVLADAATDLGYSIGKKVETDLLAGIPLLRGGVLGAKGSAFDLSYIMQARAILETNGVPGPYTAVIHPYHYLDIASEMAKLSNAAPINQRDAAFNSYLIGRIGGIDIVTSSLMSLTTTAAEVQTVTINGSPTGGTFTLTYNGETTAAIAYNAAASAVDSALEALSTLGASSVVVTGSAGGPYTVTFASALGNVSTLVADGSGLTGGSSPSVAIATTTPGVTYAKAGVFNRLALALDIRRGFRVEPQRDASRRGTELNATMIYGAGIWRSEWGVIVEADATAPNA